MSLVGPRPIRPSSSRSSRASCPPYWQRLVVRPGLTGLRAGAARLRDLDGREARARPRVDRRPLRPPLPAHARRDRAGASSASRRAAWSGPPTRVSRHVRDLRDRLGAAGAVDAARLARDERDARPPRARQRRDGARRAGRRSPRAGSRSSTSRRATSRSRTRTARSPSSRTARSTTTASCARELERAGPPLPHAAATPRCSSHLLRGVRATASRGGCAACSPSRSGTRRAAGSCSRATATGSSRSTTAPPAAGSSSPPSCARCRAARSTSTRSRRSSPSTRIPGPLTSSGRRASCRPATCSSGRTASRGSSATRGPPRRRRTSCATATRPSSPRSCARGSATPSART